MKRLLHIIILLSFSSGVFAQQFPFMEGYTLNPFNMTPAYAGILNPKTVFIDYRSDWSGIDGGPTTYQLSYSDRYKDRVGLGGRFIYDKTDIFKQTMLLGTYTYEVKINDENRINFGLSAGFFRNSIDLAKYYSDPSYVSDAVLLYGQAKSKIKFATDLSAIYRYKSATAGILFSNVMFGSARYNSSDIAYKPMKNFLIHATYDYKINDIWEVKPFIMVRGGQDVPTQLEFAGYGAYKETIWGTLLFRTGGIFGFGFGGEIYDGILLNYSYNLSSNVALNTFGSHQITLGVKLFRFIGKGNKSDNPD